MVVNYKKLYKTAGKGLAGLGYVAYNVGSATRQARPSYGKYEGKRGPPGSRNAFIRTTARRHISQIQKGKKMKKMGISTGRQRYSGKVIGPFRKARKVRKNMFLAKGFEHTIEVNGQVSDPDCVYVGHCTHVGTLMIEIICQSLLRKLFTKAGLNITSITQHIAGTSVTAGPYTQFTGDQWRIIVSRQNKETGAYEWFLYDTPGGSDLSISNLIGNVSTGTAGLFSDFTNIMKEFAGGAAGTSSSNVKVPYKLALYRCEKVGDGSVTNSYQFVCELNLANETIHFGTSSQLKIQNRTVSADGGTTNDNVSNNPIEGRKYVFRNGTPYSRIEETQRLEIFPATTGCITARAAQFSGSALGLTEPPPAQIFSNCSGTSKVGLQPGHIKYDYMSYKTSQNLLTYLTSFGYGVGANSYQKKIRGKSTLFALEDVINVSVNSNIVIAYEINRKYGCYFTTQRATPALGARFQITQDSIPA